MTAKELLPRLQAVKVTGEGWMARCPAHEDHTPSLSIKEGSDGKILLHCHAGCAANSVCAALGIEVKDLFPPKEKRNGTTRRTVAETYDYRDEVGEVLFQVVRYVPKGFKQRHSDGRGGWIDNLQGVRRVLYRLPQLIEAVGKGLPVFVVEGEKDCNAMHRAGLVATTNPCGADAWRSEFGAFFKDALVCIIADKDPPGRARIPGVAANIKPFAKRLVVIELPDVGQWPVKDSSDFLGAGGTAAEIIALSDAAPEWQPGTELINANKLNPPTTPTTPTTTSTTETLGERIAGRLFNIHAKPDEPTPRFYVGNSPICTPGNITAISAPPKSAKSSFVGAMLAATMAPLDGDADCLGVRSANPDGLAVIHLDTEQSLADHYALVERAINRAGLKDPPPWLRSYCVTGFSIPDARACVSLVMAADAEKFGGVHSVIMDGAADMVADVNDPAECNTFVSEMHSLAITYDCPIAGVIHLNPGTEKSRGHLGSQLERKAETNLRLERDGDAFIVWAEKNRRAPITKDHGPRFQWSDEHHMFVSVQCAADAKLEAISGELRLEAEAVFSAAGKNALKWAEFNALLMQESKLSKGGARKRFDKMLRARVVKKEIVGLYVLA